MKRKIRSIVKNPVVKKRRTATRKSKTKRHGLFLHRPSFETSSSLVSVHPAGAGLYKINPKRKRKRVMKKKRKMTALQLKYFGKGHAKVNPTRKRKKIKSSEANTMKRRRRRVHRITPKRRRRSVHHIRRNPSGNVTGLLMNGALAGAGAGVAVFLTNIVSKLVSGKDEKGVQKEMTGAMKNWLLLGISAAMSFILPKVKLGKYADSMVTGALAISVINIASTSLGMEKFFTLSGDASIDDIINKLDLSGWDKYGLLGEGNPDAANDAETLLGDGRNLLGIVEGIVEGEITSMDEYA